MRMCVFLFMMAFGALLADDMLMYYAEPKPIQSFSNDEGRVVVNLADASVWKVHPDHATQAAAWEIGDKVYIQVRKSCYWFKREHKFRIMNETKGESVKAMIIDHGASPLRVTEVSEPVYTFFDEVPIYAEGEDRAPVAVGTKWVFDGKKMTLNLNRGSLVVVRDHFDKFQEETELHLGVDNRKGYQGLFLIVGEGKDAVWTPIYPVE